MDWFKYIYYIFKWKLIDYLFNNNWEYAYKLSNAQNSVIFKNAMRRHYEKITNYLNKNNGYINQLYYCKKHELGLIYVFNKKHNKPFLAGSFIINEYRSSESEIILYCNKNSTCLINAFKLIDLFYKDNLKSNACYYKITLKDRDYPPI